MEVTEGLKSEDKRRRLVLSNLCHEMGEMGGILGSKPHHRIMVYLL